MFKKILIANRGEIAVRIIRTCKELGIPTVAVYSTADKDSLHVLWADEAVCIGVANSTDSYLNIPRIIAACEITGADAVHPGYGFLSENAHFSKVCAENNIQIIGSSPQTIKKMGDKATAKATMLAAKVACVPGFEGLIADASMAKKVAAQLGYPVIIKATAGGGGKGMRVIDKEEDLKAHFEMAQQEAKAAFGNEGLYMEKYIRDPRHIEIQVAGDRYGNACHFSERDCSVQRRNQKLVEETPSPFMTQALREAMGETAVQAIRAIGYEGVGTIEFLVDKDRNFYFMEMNTRIQVEHTITEEVTGIDLIALQIAIAAGKPIENKNYYPQKHAIECRINAEDPSLDFRPAPGKITAYHTPGGLGVRVDSHAYADYSIPPYYDSMIAKLITVGSTREEAIRRMQRALDEYVIEGVATTLPFHKKLMAHATFVEGNCTTQFLEKNPIHKEK